MILIFLLWLISWLAARSLIINKPLQSADVMAVLSGAEAYKERTRYAAEVYHAGRAPRIVLTNDNYRGGWSPVEERNPFYYELEKDELVRLGVPKTSIDIVLEPVDGTYTESRVLRRYAEAKQFKSMLVVTSAYHSRRTWWTLLKVFDGSGMLLGVESVPTGFQTPNPSTWWIHVTGWKVVPPEYIKIAYYWMSIP